MERNSDFFCTNRHIYSLCATDTSASTARPVTTHKYGKRYFLMRCDIYGIGSLSFQLI